MEAGVGTGTAGRPPGWFVASGGRPLPGDRPPATRSGGGRLALVVAGRALLVGGLATLVAPVSVIAGSVTGSCPSPVFLGRYDAGSPPDLAATVFTACWNQAQVRKHLGVVALVAGVAVLAAAYGLVALRAARADRRR